MKKIITFIRRLFKRKKPYPTIRYPQRRLVSSEELDADVDRILKESKMKNGFDN
jgi:hypothetical protein